MRVQKYLSDVGFCSRRQAERLIRAGKIVINGNKATLGDRVSENDTIIVDGHTLQSKALSAKKVIMFHKPKGVDCTLTSNPWMKTLLDYDFGTERVFPIGSLDNGSHGLLLLTNDGELGNRIAQPSAGREEEYLLVAENNYTPEIIERLRQGIKKNNKVTVPHRIEQLKENVLSIVLQSERCKYIRKISEAVGVQIQDLKRIRIGTIEMGELKAGNWLVLDSTAFAELKKDAPVPRGRRRIVVGHR